MSWQESSVVKRLKCHTPAALHTWDNDTRPLCVALGYASLFAHARARAGARARTNKDARVSRQRQEERQQRAVYTRRYIRVGGGGEVLSSDVINALARLELSRVEAGVIPANCA